MATPANHDSVTTHIEPEILECKIEWALGSNTTSKEIGGERIAAELFQILKDDAVKVLHSICQQSWKTQQWPQDWKRSVFISISKKGNAKECSNYCTTALISHDSKVMLKILQARLQQYVNRELPDVQAEFRKGRGTKDQIANICWIVGKSNRIPEKHLLLLHWLYQSFWLYGSYKLWKIPKEMGISDYLICRLRNLYADQEQLTWNNRLVPNWEKSTSKMYIVTLLI